MDILEANFPQLLHKKPTVQQMRDAESLPIVGQRGVAKDETPFAGGFIRCDDVFLESLMDHLRLAELMIYIADDSRKVATHYMANRRSTQPLEYDEDIQLREAITVVSKVAPEIERLGAHPELFVSDARKAEFLLEAGRLAFFCDQYINIMEDEQGLRLSLESELEDAASRRPLDEHGNRLQPWEMFAPPIDVNRIAHLPQTKILQDRVPGMHLQKAQMLPPSALLIAKHRKEKQDWYFSTAVEPPPADVLALQHTMNELIRDVSRTTDGIAVAKAPMAVAAVIDQMSRAWGKQEKVAEMSRLMALLDNNVTSVGAPPIGAFLGTFLTDEGMQQLRDQEAALKKEPESEE